MHQGEGGGHRQLVREREREGASSSFKPKLSRLKADYAEKRVDGEEGWWWAIVREKKKEGRKEKRRKERWRKNASRQKNDRDASGRHARRRRAREE